MKKFVKFADMKQPEDNTHGNTILSIPKRIWSFYYEGFRSMTVGKTLWIIILVKLFIFFAVLRILFFPDILQRDFDTDEQRAEHVRHELTNR